MTMSNEERIARLEAGYEHLATKADVENLRGDLNSGLSSVRGELNSGPVLSARRLQDGHRGGSSGDNSPDRPAVLGDSGESAAGC